VIALGAQTDAGPACAAADVLLQPTIYDTFGLAIAEAMAHGLPPIVTARAGITELIAHQRSGWIVREATPQALAHALRTVAGDATLRERLGRGARAVAAARSWDDVARETLQVYREAHGSDHEGAS
jgi:UDP-glucose:(heptosyl)LPS alpha-1,3-glucosyltransferase